ncbi:solute:Na+ SSS family symporter, response regulator receiver and PAS sensor-containing signal transduction histidine kinase [Oleiphilus messinensis]|uniref:histidine kinase n=1 Tax=Oleiphilus messinensis TaxID=141451 RepID=A0A1Y0I6N8_9GAMM|nr:NahK/ErcS family hybrid sensor histidine kinase/response regulator [Oleiphilus messinensis]ARU56101.1 solute:Na+ SSS family symporter, response regulator receiver and PAS sensor-containing signal transduction histidine kinase [Oleiphilus messinensis]
MIPGWILIGISVFYALALFMAAYYGDKMASLPTRPLYRATVYSLSLAVYCTSWTFYGAVGRATNEGIGFLPIYLGPFLFIIFFTPLIQRIINMSKRQNITSIADFIASRYGKSQLLAVMVTTIATIGILPYIALQLKAVAMSYSLLTTGSTGINIQQVPVGVDPAWYSALLMALFALLFGTRHIEATEHHQGMMQAIALESIIKLVAFLAVGIFVCYFLYQGMDDIFLQLSQKISVESFVVQNVDATTFLTQTLIAMCAIICLPRQFHVTVVENYDAKDMNVARWLMPIYLVLISIFVIPIAAAGMLTFPLGEMNTDTFVLSVPMQNGPSWLSILAFIGGGSAATAMVIVSAVTLSTMVCNEIVIPGLLTLFGERLKKRRDLGPLLIATRRVAILIILLCAYGFYRIAAAHATLTSFGLLSFAAAAQFAPALIGGATWRQGNYQGAMIGILVGFTVWFITLLLPTLALADRVPAEVFEFGVSTPLNWVSQSEDISESSRVTQGMIWSLGLNTLCYIIFSMFTRQKVRERIQVAAFFQESDHSAHEDELVGEATVRDLQAVAERFLGPEKAQSILDYYERRFLTRLSPGKKATRELLRYIESQLASVIGSSTARVVLDSTLKGRDMQIEDVVSIVDEASQVMQFNRDLLQSAIENISLGISVVDNQQRLVAWNQRYLELFNYPKGFVRVGRPIADLVRFNLILAGIPSEKIDELIRNRIELMQTSETHEYERERPDGSVLLIQGTPTAGGGFVTTFADITRMRKTEQALKESNIYLEQRVTERTNELSYLNSQLSKAKAVAEQANQSKTRFLASASHDLLQPLNAARLFSSALQAKEDCPEEQRELLAHIDSSLSAAEEILNTLLDISKLDAGVLEPQFSAFTVTDLLRPLDAEFSAIAAEKNLTLHVIHSSAVVRSDLQLLRRLIQNLLSNACRYTQSGRIVLGCRRQQNNLKIQVWDTGTGIPEDQLTQIFEEFKRLNRNQDKKGLGLGLAIVDRISHVLHHPVEVQSWLGKGSVFSVTVPYGQLSAEIKPTIEARIPGSIENLRVLCIDNDAHILNGLKALLQGWHCEVQTAMSLTEAQDRLRHFTPEIILADYQLDNDENGLDVLDNLNSQRSPRIPGILVTAVTADELKQETLSRGYQFLNKPVKPAALRAMVSKKVSRP